jgi:cephalosporin-C deacetylase-like acetyl esterase
MDNILRQIVFDHKQALDWIGMQDDIDSERIGVFGISMGSIKAALISSLDRRIKVSVMCLTGGNLAEIIATSDEGGVVRRRKEYMKEHDVTEEMFYDLLQSKITCDPMEYAEYIDAENSLMVLAYFDSAVPYKNGNELWEKIGQPEKITMLTGHYTAILGLPYVKMKSLDFFDRKLR